MNVCDSVCVCVCVCARVPFLPGRTPGSDTGLARPLESSDFIMLACPPSLFASFFISCRERERGRGGGEEVMSGGGEDGW